MANTQRYGRLLSSVLLVLLPICLFLPLRHFEFIPFVDDEFSGRSLYENGEFTLSAMFHLIAAADASGWHPIPRLSFVFDSLIYGKQAGGFHVSNLLLHVANVLLLSITLRSLTGRLWASTFVAALFAVHPVQVDPVTWLTGRHVLLATFFGLCTIHLYARHVQTGCPGRYWASVVAFACSLLSQSALLALPCLLLLFNYWPLKRTDRNAAIGLMPTESQAPSTSVWTRVFKRLGTFVDIVPFLAVTAGFAFAGFRLHASAAAVNPTAMPAWSSRLGSFFVEILFDVQSVFCPVELFARPTELDFTWYLTAGLLVFIVTTLGVWLAERLPFLVAGWLWFVGTSIPIVDDLVLSGAANQYRQMYIPVVGLLVAVTWLAITVFDSPLFQKAVLPTLSIAVLGVGVFIARETVMQWPEQIPYWTAVGVQEMGGSFEVEETGIGVTVNRVSLATTQVSDADLSNLLVFSRLRVLDLSETAITDSGLRQLTGLRELQMLQLNGTNVTDAGMGCLTDFAHLQAVELNGTLITDAALKHLAKLPQLQALSLTITHVGGKGFVHFGKRSRLEVLIFGGPQVTDGSLEHIAEFSHLRWLDLSQSRITDTGLSRLQRLSNLDKLDLSFTNIDGSGLSHLQSLKRLASLSLLETPITDGNLAHLSAFPRLSRLVLDSTDIGDPGLKRLRAVKSLETLTLANTRITDLGLRDLGNLHRLQKLSLAGNPISDSGLAHLYGLRKLSDLELSHTIVTAAGLRKLQDRLPQVRITPHSARK